MRFHVRTTLAGALALLALAAGRGWSQTAPRGEEALLDFFEKKVRPVLANNCFNCHSASTNAKGGLRVDDRNGLLQGGRSGPGVTPGHPEKSELLLRIRHADDTKRMPPKKQLSDQEIADLTQWIADGAAWPKLKVPAHVGRPNPKHDALRKEHWAWQPLREVKVPAVRDAAWPRGDIDRFVRAKLEDKNLAPVADADPVALLRRLTFDLTGLPPTQEEVESFIADCKLKIADVKSQSAIAHLHSAMEKAVDRLLASPAFGERWGRYWLDVARYGESTGSSRNLPLPHAWRYRDYVIDAFNSDKPYDVFIREQIAGDLLAAATPKEREQQLIATGFLALGVKDVNQRFKVRFTMDNIDEQIDTVTRSVLALTASCARCHDHKFDPISTTDYYALAGIFHSTDLCSGLRNKMGGGGLDYYDPTLLLSLGTGSGPNPNDAEKIAQARQAVAKARTDFETLRDSPEGNQLAPDGRLKKAVARQKMNRLQNELNALIDPALSSPVAMGARDAKTVGDTEIRIRGEAEKLGPVVPRGFLSVLNVPNVPRINPKQSGRLELAHWLTSPQNPLTSRVIVNRVWKHLFGQGLVSSVDNFGVTGDVPTHPELLDHLAAQFVKQGWSIKKLVRELVLTRTYQLDAAATAEHQKIDPANRLLWRHSPRRLDAEEIRDATLAASGLLDATRPKASPAQDLKVVELRNNGPEARRLQDEANNSLHRSVYLPLLRGLTPRSLEVFDFAEQGMVTGSRDTTTVAPQALYLLNDPFVRKQALALAQRLLKLPEARDSNRIQQAYQWTLGRSPSAQETARAESFLADYEAAVRQEFARNPPPKSAAAQETAPKNSPTPKPATPINPDLIDQTDEPVREETVQAANPRTAAWASFCQALLGSAEFRYLR